MYAKFPDCLGIHKGVIILLKFCSLGTVKILKKFESYFKNHTRKLLDQNYHLVNIFQQEKCLKGLQFYKKN